MHIDDEVGVVQQRRHRLRGKHRREHHDPRLHDPENVDVRGIFGGAVARVDGTCPRVVPCRLHQSRAEFFFRGEGFVLDRRRLRQLDRRCGGKLELEQLDRLVRELIGGERFRMPLDDRHVFLRQPRRLELPLQLVGADGRLVLFRCCSEPQQYLRCLGEGLALQDRPRTQPVVSDLVRVRIGIAGPGRGGTVVKTRFVRCRRGIPSQQNVDFGIAADEPCPEIAHSRRRGLCINPDGKAIALEKPPPLVLPGEDSDKGDQCLVDRNALWPCFGDAQLAAELPEPARRRRAHDAIVQPGLLCHHRERCIVRVDLRQRSLDFQDFRMIGGWHLTRERQRVADVRRLRVCDASHRDEAERHGRSGPPPPTMWPLRGRGTNAVHGSIHVTSSILP